MQTPMGPSTMQPQQEVISEVTAVVTEPTVPDKRPDIPQHVRSQVKDWFNETDNLTQRKNALWEFREVNKILFPERFDPTDPRRGQTPYELRSGKDNRRVRTPYIFRDTIQTTALAVPEDMTFTWSMKPQVKPKEMQGIPLSPTINDTAQTFGETLDIVQHEFLDEAKWIEKIQAFVQDSSCYPIAAIKFWFYRDYKTSPLTTVGLNRDTTDTIARLESLMRQFSMKQFTQDSSQYATMLDMFKTIRSQAEVSRYIGIVIQLLPMDSFGVSEEVPDIVDIYDAPYMFHDTLKSGDELLSRYPYSQGEDGETYGILMDELTQAIPWDTNNTSTDPNSRNRVSRNRQLTMPMATAVNMASTTGSPGTDPRKRKYIVREIWCKRDGKVYTMVRGLDHYLECNIPEKTSEQWYPFIVLAPNRVPGEIYQASDASLKKDIQARIHRKKTDEEKARFLHQDRYIYNTTMVDSKEIVKLGDIPPGQFRGINLGSGMKITDAVMPLSTAFKPESYDTSKDERDKDMMGALPVQALGTTGSANFATEVSVASQGMSVATQFRQNIIRRSIDRLLNATAQILIQELSRDEVQRIAGPFAAWPDIYSEQEADRIVNEAKNRAMEQVAPIVMSAAIQDAQSGIPLDPTSIKAALEAQAAPVWQQEMIQKYGNIEPMTRQSLFSRLKVKVKSSLLSSLDRQQRINSMNMLAGSVLQLAQAAQATGQVFNPRPMFKNFSLLNDDNDSIDEMFPGVNPLQMAAQQITDAAGEVPGSPVSQGPQGAMADQGREEPGVEQQQSPGTPTLDQAQA